MRNQMITNLYENIIYAEFYGELDNNSTLGYKEKLADLIDKELPSALILDFTFVSFIDSSGLGLVLGRYNQLRQIDSKLIVTGINEQTNKLFKMSGIYNIIEQAKTKEHALALAGQNV